MIIKPPHLDAPPCPTCGDAGALVPAESSGAHPLTAAIPLAIRCAACGTWAAIDPADPDDLRRLLQVWWSAGAWAGKRHAEENRK